MNIQRLLIIYGLILCSTVLKAQSAEELHLAKQLARQHGYSDAQIAVIANRLAGGNIT